MSESVILRKILIRASELGSRLFRNQVGVYELKDGRWLTSGLCVGSSDLIGWTPVVITPEMIGRTLAVFTAVETKRPKKDATDKQSDFIAAVVNAGGIAGVARSVEDLEHLTKGENGACIADRLRQGASLQHPLGHVALPASRTTIS